MIPADEHTHNQKHHWMEAHATQLARKHASPAWMGEWPFRRRPNTMQTNRDLETLKTIQDISHRIHTGDRAVSSTQHNSRGTRGVVNNGHILEAAALRHAFDTGEPRRLMWAVPKHRIWKIENCSTNTHAAVARCARERI